MFIFHIAFALSLISLASGAALFGCASKNNSCCPFLTKAIGFLILIFSLCTTVCLGYCGIMLWKQGVFPMQMQQMSQIMQKNSMMPANKATTATVSPQKTHHK